MSNSAKQPAAAKKAARPAVRPGAGKTAASRKRAVASSDSSGVASTTATPRAKASPRRSGGGANGRANAGPDARTRILNAAGALIAERGLEGVSLREITRESGQKNTTALQYHFGDREGMLRALVDQYVPRVSVRRHALLDHLLSRGEITLREGAAILVTPLISELSDECGRHFLQVAAQLVNRSDALVDPDDALGALVYDPDGSLARWSPLIETLMPPRTAGPPLHRRFAAVRFTHIELGRRARLAQDTNAELFAAQLIDLVAAILGADLSPETSRIMDERHPE